MSCIIARSRFFIVRLQAWHVQIFYLYWYFWYIHHDRPMVTPKILRTNLEIFRVFDWTGHVEMMERNHYIPVWSGVIVSMICAHWNWSKMIGMKNAMFCHKECISFAAPQPVRIVLKRSILSVRSNKKRIRWKHSEGFGCHPAHCIVSKPCPWFTQHCLKLLGWPQMLFSYYTIYRIYPDHFYRVSSKFTINNDVLADVVTPQGTKKAVFVNTEISLLLFMSNCPSSFCQCRWLPLENQSFRKLDGCVLEVGF